MQSDFGKDKVLQQNCVNLKCQSSLCSFDTLLITGGKSRTVKESEEIHKQVLLKQSINNKSQNCVKAAIAFVCTTCKRQLLFEQLQLIAFVCTSANENILCTTVIVNFCMH